MEEMVFQDLMVRLDITDMTVDQGFQETQEIRWGLDRVSNCIAYFIWKLFGELGHVQFFMSSAWMMSLHIKFTGHSR